MEGWYDVISCWLTLTTQHWRKWDLGFSLKRSALFLWISFAFIHCFCLFIFMTDPFPNQSFSWRLDSRIEHQCWGCPHWGQQWCTEIDLSPCHQFPKSFPAWRTTRERIQVMLGYFIFGLISIFSSFFLFLVRQHARTCDALWLLYRILRCPPTCQMEQFLFPPPFISILTKIPKYFKQLHTQKFFFLLSSSTSTISWVFPRSTSRIQGVNKIHTLRLKVFTQDSKALFHATEWVWLCLTLTPSALSPVWPLPLPWIHLPLSLTSLMSNSHPLHWTFILLHQSWHHGQPLAIQMWPTD